MRNFYKLATHIVLVFLGAISITLNAQTPGKIVRDGQWQTPPNLPGSFLLDPNGDGYVSASASGFTGGCDIGPGCSEINYRFVPVINGEILADLRRGPTGQYSEIVPDANGRGLYVRFDGSNILGRLRIGSTMSGAKGYSILVDADGKFGATGPNADPEYSPQTTGTNGNPGYEFEIVLRSAFGVAVYFINNSCAVAPQLIYENTTSTASIVSIAATNNNGDPDYFYDFHVPLSALNHGGFTVNATTPLRIQTTTVMSPQGAICGPKSDIYGRDTDFGTANDQFEKLFGSACPFTLNDITDAGSGIPATVCTEAPFVNTGISSVATSVSGTWTKASYSTENSTTIIVYKNGNLLGTLTNVATGSTWTLTGVTLANGDLITATAQSSGECICQSSNTVRVVACTPATTSVCPVVTCATARGIQGTGVIGATIRIYRITNAGQTLIASGILTTTTWSFAGGTTTGNDNKVCATGNPNDFGAGSYLVTQEEPGKCQTGTCTIVTTDVCTLTATPVINQAVVLNNTANLTGTVVSGSFVRLFLNGTEVASQTASGVIYSFPLSSYNLNVGDVLEVSAQSGTLCISARVSRTVSCFIAPPVITASESGFVASGSPISGVSSAAAGTIVSVFNNATNALVGTANVTSSFTWATSFNAAAGTSYYATQSTACGLSGRSAVVTGTTPTSNARCGTITGPVLENAINVSGSLSSAVANTLVRLFIDGALVGEVTTSTINWSIPVTQTTPSGVIVPLIFAGGLLTVEISQPNQIGVVCPGTTTVQCIAPVNNYTFSITPTGTGGNGNSSDNRHIFSGNSINVIVNGTQDGVLYTLEDESGTDQSQTIFGSSAGAIVFSDVSTPLLPGNYNWRIKATKPGSCTEVSTNLFLQQAVFTVSGVVRNDTDGLTDGEVDGAGYADGGLNAVLVSGDNVVAVVAVDPDGTFTFNGVQNGTYTIQLSTANPTIGQPAPAVSLPLGWVSTGDYLGTGAGSDGPPANSILSVTVAGGVIANARFGIQQLPTSGSGANNVDNAGGTNTSIIPASTFTNIANSTDVDPGIITSIRITSFPTNATSITIGPNTYFLTDIAALTALVIPTDANGNPTPVISLNPSFEGAGTSVISFIAIDNAGSQSINPGTATLNFFERIFTNAPGISPQCIIGKPSLNYTLTANFDPTGMPLNITWIRSGNTTGLGGMLAGASPIDQVVHTVPNISGANVTNNGNGTWTITGTDLWPGAALDINGNMIEWPGYVLENNVWLYKEDGYGQYRNGPTVNFSINPDITSGPAGYPVPTPACKTNPPGFSITGKVFTDTDGLTDLVVDGLDYTNQDLFAVLVGANNIVANVVPVEADGTYTFTNVLNATFSLLITTTSVSPGDAAPAANLPAGWVHTGEDCCDNTGSDGVIPDGILTGIIISGGDILNANFGIQQPPYAGGGTNNASNRGGTQQVIVPANTFTRGDGVTANPSTDPTPGTLTSIRIVAFPTGATTIVINGTRYSATGSGTGNTAWPAGGIIVPVNTDGTPSQVITVDPASSGNTTVTIPFRSIDNAGMESLNIGNAILILTATPDLSPSIVLPSNTFNIGETKDAQLNVTDISMAPTVAGTATFSVTIPSGYIMEAYNNTLTTFTPSGGSSTAVNNTQFSEFSRFGNTIIFRANAGVIIPGLTLIKLGIRVTRTTANSGSVSRMTIGISNDATRVNYDSNTSNNTFTRILNAQQPQ